MPAIDVSTLSKDTPPNQPLIEAVSKGGYFIHEKNTPWNMVVIDGGMSSGDPSVLVWVRTNGGVVVLETSLKAWRTASVTACAMAEAQFGWDGGMEDT